MSDYRRHVGRLVVVQLDDISIRGTLSRDGNTCMELEDAASLSTDGSSRPIDGTVLVPLSRIDWVQVP